MEYYEMNKNKLFKVILALLCIIAGIFVAYKISYYLAPFIIALIIAWLMEPMVGLLAAKIKMPRKLASLVVLLFILVFLGLVLIIVITNLVNEIKGISYTLPGYFAEFYNNINLLVKKLSEIYLQLPPEITDNIRNIILNLSNSLTDIINSIVGGIFATAVSIPEILIFVFATILAAYFFSSDKEKITGFIKTHLPESWIVKLRNIRSDMFSALFGYLKALLILMSITFAVLFIGFIIIRIKYALLLAFLICIIDALPVFGTGTVLIPWSLYAFLTGDIRIGVSILILYGIILIVRQIIEPKIVGNQIGVYPLLTLIAMYLGFKLFGVFGLIAGPFIVLLLKSILSGIFKKRPLKDILSGKSTPR